MTNIHFEILNFLKKSGSPVHLDQFPNSIGSEFLPGLSPRSLLHELEVVLRNQKKWIKQEPKLRHSYLLTEDGLSTINKELGVNEIIFAKNNRAEKKENLEIQNLRTNVSLLTDQLLIIKK